MMKFLLLGAATLAFAAPASAQNLLVNGGFDADDVPDGGFKIYNAGDTIGGGGWTVLGNGGNSGLNLSTTYAEPGVLFAAQSGPVSADLTAAGNTGFANGLSQTFATVAGRSYSLSFWVGNADGNGNYTLPSSITASVGGVSLGTFTNAAITPGTTNWVQFTQRFVATGASTELVFGNATPGGDNFAGLDTVSVTNVPEPATWAMMIGGIGAAGGSLRTRARRKAAIA